MLRTRRIAAMLCAAMVWTVAEGADEWAQWRGRHRDGKSPDTGLLKEWKGSKKPKLVWKFTRLGDGYSSVSAANGLLYATGGVSGKMTVFALDERGKVRWKRPLSKAWTGRRAPGARTTPTIDDGRLYVMSGFGELHCLDAKSGRPIWNRGLTRDFRAKVPTWGYSESVLIVDDKVIANPGGRNCVVALDKKTGKTRWTSRANGAAAHYVSPILVEYQGARMIVNGNRGGLFAVDAKDGRPLWQNDFARNNTANVPTPAFSDGYVFWAVGYRKGGVCVKLEVSGGKVRAREVYKTDDMVCHHGGYIIRDGCVYGNNGGGWACLELKTGKVKWNGRGVGKGSVCYADGMLYTFAERRGSLWLVAAKPDGLEVRGKIRVVGDSRWSWAHPAVIDGKLYLRFGSKLYCLDVREK